VLSILVLTIIGASFLSPAYAGIPTSISLNVSPNPALPNQAVTFSGQVTPAAADSITVFVHSGSLTCPDDIRFVPLAVNLAPSTLTPSNLPIHFTGTADSTGFYSITVPGGFAVGLYGVIAVDESTSIVSNCDPFTVSTVIPEYPFGLAILAIFMVIGYGVIRRRTITK
jgi:hypothetical protein